jgi:hypothetical protein
MKISFWEQLSFRIFILFLIAIFSTFIPEYCHNFFGDWYCSGSGLQMANFHFPNCDYLAQYHTSTWHWGYRHWLWLIMCLTLFIVNAARIIQYINNPTTD